MTWQQRFWTRVDRRGDDECWMWLGAIDRSGYARVRIDGQRFMVHRVSYELIVGSIPKGLTLDHLCRNRSCVNPRHLEPVTLGENVLRGESVSGINARKVVCDHGHTLDDAYVVCGKRKCKECNRINVARYRAAHRDHVNARKRERYAKKHAA